VAAGGERTLDDDRAGIDDQARRLYLSRWLTRRAQAVVGGAVPDDASAESLIALAVRFRGLDSEKGPLGGMRFEPPYPGDVVESTTAGGKARVLLASTVSAGTTTLGAVFTVLIAGRNPEVSVAPPSAAAQLRIDGGEV
jgi:hypothetical protein